MKRMVGAQPVRIDASALKQPDGSSSLLNEKIQLSRTDDNK